MEASGAGNRDYNTISPSAKSLLLMKGYTGIPCAARAAELIMLPEAYSRNFHNKPFGFWARVAHFEIRYFNIDLLLKDLQARNILELSSGFSFRGLATVAHNDVHYIDTDLPDLIEKKKELVAVLQKEQGRNTGVLETLPLNALDEDRFLEITNHFPDGEIVIVNEGLLMYLGNSEKERLCRIIRKVLEKRGGYWITSDVYIKKEEDHNSLGMDDKLKQFFEEHRIEENKFESFEAAGQFFAQAGFIIDKEAQPDYSKISAIKYLRETATEQQLTMLNKRGKMQVTWRLKVAKR